MIDATKNTHTHTLIFNFFFSFSKYIFWEARGEFELFDMILIFAGAMQLRENGLMQPILEGTHTTPLSPLFFNPSTDNR